MKEGSLSYSGPKGKHNLKFVEGHLIGLGLDSDLLVVVDVVISPVASGK